jgi:site-specific recombinase XerD
MSKRSRKKPKKHKRRALPLSLTPGEATSLLAQACAAADGARTPVKAEAARRDYVMIQTGLLAGPRLAELCNLKVVDVDLSSAVLEIRHGKGDKDRIVPLGKLRVVLRSWIGDRTEGYLFPGPNGKRLGHRTFQSRLKRVMGAAKIQAQKAHPHILRHTFATTLLKKKVNLCVIQRLLGHSSVATTQIYLGVDVDDLREAIGAL